MARNLWTDDEMILVLDLYFKLPFGRLNRRTHEVKELAKLIRRTDSSVAFRLVNYAACDPYILETGRHGMDAGRGKCLPYWNEYAHKKELLFLKAQEIKARLHNITLEEQLFLKAEDFYGSTREVTIQQRVNQFAFREMILSNYENRCALTGIDIPELLVASHIVPWSVDESNRLNPSNGICLSPLYDKMFDRGYIGIREDYTVELSKELKQNIRKDYYDEHVAIIEDRRLIMPVEHAPNLDFLEYHYNNIFSRHN